MCLCKRGTTSLLEGPLRWVNDYHVVFWRSTDHHLEALHAVLEYNTAPGADPKEIWWVTEGNPHTKDLPETIMKHISEMNVHVIY